MGYIGALNTVSLGKSVRSSVTGNVFYNTPTGIRTVAAALTPTIAEILGEWGEVDAKAVPVIT